MTSQDPDPLVDVVVVAHRSRDVLRDCVEPLAAWPRARVVAVDTDSGDGALETVADLGVETVQAPRNGGFGYGCNLGVRLGGAPWLCFLNPDVRIEPGDVELLARRLAREPRAAVVGPRIEDERGRLQPSRRRFPRLRSTIATALFLQRLAPRSTWADEVEHDPAAYLQAGPVDWLTGACLLVRRDSFEAVGGFDEGYFLYSEEIDLSRRLRDRGMATLYEPAARCTHAGGGSAPRAALLAAQLRSRVRYAAIHEGTANARLTALAMALFSLVRVPLSVGRGGQAAGRLGAFRAGLAAAVRPPGPQSALEPPG